MTPVLLLWTFWVRQIRTYDKHLRNEYRAVKEGQWRFKP